MFLSNIIFEILKGVVGEKKELKGSYRNTKRVFCSFHLFFNQIQI